MDIVEAEIVVVQNYVEKGNKVLKVQRIYLNWIKYPLAMCCVGDRTMVAESDSLHIASHAFLSDSFQLQVHMTQIRNVLGARRHNRENLARNAGTRAPHCHSDTHIWESYTFAP